jgi:hypothetical protein
MNDQYAEVTEREVTLIKTDLIGFALSIKGHNPADLAHLVGISPEQMASLIPELEALDRKINYPQ